MDKLEIDTWKDVHDGFLRVKKKKSRVQEKKNTCSKIPFLVLKKTTFIWACMCDYYLFIYSVNKYLLSYFLSSHQAYCSE